MLENDLLNLTDLEKFVVSAGKLFYMLMIRMLKKSRLLKVKYRCLCNIIMHDRVVTGFLK